MWEAALVVSKVTPDRGPSTLLSWKGTVREVGLRDTSVVTEVTVPLTQACGSGVHIPGYF